MSTHKQKRFRDTWVNQTRLGQQFGISAITIGKKLTDLDLRGKDKQPTSQAIEEGFCKFTPMKNGTPFFLWNADRVAILLRKNGMTELSHDEQEAYETAKSFVDLEHSDESYADKLWGFLIDETPVRLYPLANRFLVQLGSNMQLES